MLQASESNGSRQNRKKRIAKWELWGQLQIKEDFQHKLVLPCYMVLQKLESHSATLKLLSCFATCRVHPWLDRRTAKIMNQLLKYSAVCLYKYNEVSRITRYHRLLLKVVEAFACVMLSLWINSHSSLALVALPKMVVSSPSLNLNNFSMLATFFITNLNEKYLFSIGEFYFDATTETKLMKKPTT